jgi:acetyl-CoA carboxylase beta subunit
MCRAPLVGLLQRALRDRPAVVLLAESGGVRLHEANAGLIAVSEVMRAVLDGARRVSRWWCRRRQRCLAA